MANITYIEFNGTTHTVEVTDGKSVMEGARDFSIPGIEADCGGACACSTCHVYVAPEWVEKLPAIGVMEEEMVEGILSWPQRGYQNLIKACKSPRQLRGIN